MKSHQTIPEQSGEAAPQTDNQANSKPMKLVLDPFSSKKPRKLGKSKSKSRNKSEMGKKRSNLKSKSKSKKRGAKSSRKTGRSKSSKVANPKVSSEKKANSITNSSNLNQEIDTGFSFDGDRNGDLRGQPSNLTSARLKESPASKTVKQTLKPKSKSPLPNGGSRKAKAASPLKDSLPSQSRGKQAVASPDKASGLAAAQRSIRSPEQPPATSPRGKSRQAVSKSASKPSEARIQTAKSPIQVKRGVGTAAAVAVGVKGPEKSRMQGSGAAISPPKSPLISGFRDRSTTPTAGQKNEPAAYRADGPTYVSQGQDTELDWQEAKLHSYNGNIGKNKGFLGTYAGVLCKYPFIAKHLREGPLPSSFVPKCWTLRR
jgi:hypothetical protein